MRKVFVSYEVSVSQSKYHPLIVASPDFVFSGEFDKDDKVSFRALCDLEFKSMQVARSLKVAGFQVALVCKEISYLDID